MDAKKAQAELIACILQEEFEKLPPTRGHGRGKFLENTYEKDFIERAVNNLFFDEFGIALFDILSDLDSVRWKLRYNGETFAGLKKEATQNPDPNNPYRRASEELLKKGDDILQNLKALRNAAAILVTRKIKQIPRKGFSEGCALYGDDIKNIIQRFTASYQAFARLLKKGQLPRDDHDIARTIEVIETIQQP